MPGFMQIIEFTTSRIDEIEKLVDTYDLEGAANTARRVVLSEDRERPGTYVNIVEFDSYESAMQNSARPEVAAFAEQMAKLCDAPPTFSNLDIRIEPRTP